jgi:hypothetical protein
VATAEIGSPGKSSATGEISEQIAIPQDASAPSLDVKVSVVDSKGAQAVSNAATLKISRSVAPATAAPSPQAGPPGAQNQK